MRVMEGNPDWTFHFVGSGVAAPTIGAAKNARMYGDRPYEEAMRVLGHCVAGIIPFRNGEYNEASSFLKPLDYLAAGLHCIGTQLGPLENLQERFPAWVHLSTEARVWREALDAARAEPAPRDIDLAEWDVTKRADRLLQLLRSTAKT
jgi:hypothetical protein